MASKSTPGAGRRTSPGEPPAADGSLVNAFARAGRWHGVHSRPPQASGDQGDAGSCDPNWGQSVSPPPTRRGQAGGEEVPSRRLAPMVGWRRTAGRARGRRGGTFTDLRRDGKTSVSARKGVP